MSLVIYLPFCAFMVCLGIDGLRKCHRSGPFTRQWLGYVAACILFIVVGVACGVGAIFWGFATDGIDEALGMEAAR